MAFRVHLGIGLTGKPWREPCENFKWKKEIAEKLKTDIKGINITEDSKLKRFKALTIGLYGHGKSSLINTFASVCEDEKTTVCNAASRETNVTTKYRNYMLSGLLEQLVLGDISGLPVTKKIDPFVEDIKRILQGHVKHGYTFNPEISISSEDESYESSPNLWDKIHCALIVIDSTVAYELPATFVCGVKTIMETIDSKNIPVMAVLTKTDKLSEHVKHDVDTIFRCRKILQAVEATSKQLQIPVTKIYPVVNFEEMDHFTWKESIPILIVLKSLLLMAKMHVVHTLDVKTTK
ncbi:interferon-induced protein 44-like [Ruditapes philippinarum]|uniref:interferon-induced protein 44-like n=1 Tax=Ruditapes philippinarum TaxID=129788 RepID=UPI00295AC48D|nr:interferon-induced protein 44-like [Ruditapes philippinarum]